jgi:hypothetical protein
MLEGISHVCLLLPNAKLQIVHNLVTLPCNYVMKEMTFCLGVKG